MKWRMQALSLVAALACAPVISQKNHDAARIGYDLGIAAFNQGDSREALRSLRTAYSQDPTLPEVHNALGLVYHSLVKQDAALTHYQRAVALRPQFSEAYNNMGTLLLDMGRHDAAVQAFETALRDILYATPHLAEGNMGWAYYQKGETDLALEHIGNAVATDPQFCRGYQWLARIALDRDDAAQMVAQGQRFVRYCLDNAEVAQSVPADYRHEMQYYLALGHLKQGNGRPARELLRQCASTDPDARGFARKCTASLRALGSATDHVPLR